MPQGFEHASALQIALGWFAGPLIVSLLLAYVQKLAAESVFKHPVRLVDAFKAQFVAWFVLVSIIFTLVMTGAINLPASGGIALQIIGLIVGLVILSFTLTFFIRSPTGERPDFAKAGVVAAIMQVISLMIALLFTSMNLPIKGVYMDPDRFRSVESRT
jgi:hypothetical protein